MTNLKELDDGNSDGTRLGRSATSEISFYGATPIVQPSGASQSAIATSAITAVATSAITALSTATPIVSGYGFSTTTEAAAIATAVNSLTTRVAALVTAANSLITRAEEIRVYTAQTRTDLIALGLQKGSA